MAGGATETVENGAGFGSPVTVLTLGGRAEYAPHCERAGGIAISKSYWPFDSGAGANINEQQWRGLALALAVATPGVLTDPAVAGNYLNPFGDSTGMHVKIDTGRACVYGHTFLNDSTDTVTVTANATGSVRTDAVVVTFDFAANTVDTAVIAGPSGGALPTLTQNFTSRYDLLLGYIQVPNGAATITAGNVLPVLDRYAMPDALPVGTVIDWMMTGVAPPKGWELTVGQSKPNGKLQYPKLWAIAPTYFSGGQWGQVPLTQLILPDLRGCACVGADDMGGISRGMITAGLSPNFFIGEDTHTLTQDEIPTLDVYTFRGGNTHQAGRIGDVGTFGTGLSQDTAPLASPRAHDQPHDNMQPSVGVFKLIRIA